MLVLSIDHRDASASTIARLARGADDLARSLADDPSVRGVVVLGTCARVEAYLDASRFHDAHRVFVDTLAGAAGLPTDHVSALTRSYREVQGLEHLFRVTAGLESAVVGEVQIAGQVRDALAVARAHGTTTRPLDIGFENAMRVSRLARERLDVDDASIAAVALDQAADALPGRSTGIALVIGTGAFARTCVAELRTRGAHTVLLHSPTDRTLPAGLADDVVTSEELVLALTLSDVVVGASGHGSTVVTDAHAEQALAGRSAPLVLVDLAASGDVSRTLDSHPDVVLVRIDDVRRRALGADAAAAIASTEAAVLYPRIEGREVDEVIVALRAHVEAVADVDETVDPAVAEAMRRLTQALLHTPTVRARAAARAGELARYRSALETVFGIEHGSPVPTLSEGSVA